MMRVVMISSEQLTVRYGDVTAVDRVTFDVGEGEIFGLVGPNGAGKTSVIRALTTILEPDSGTATVDGVPLTEPAQLRSRIGVLPESSGYPGAQSAVEYLIFHARLFGGSKSDAQARSNELLDRVGLGNVARHRISTFSRGMRQRLGIARAMVSRPRALFLDEPTLGLDPAGKQEILEFLRRDTSETGSAVVLSTHLLDEVERLCDRVAIMHEARIVAVGRVAEVISSAQILSGARLDIDPIYLDRTLTVVNNHDGMRAVADDITPGRVKIDFRPDRATLTDLARLLAEENLIFISLEARGARLSDAFFQLTGAGEEVTA